MKRLLKRLVSAMPEALQFELKRAYFNVQIRRDRFVPREPELVRLKEWLRPGDWAIDVGANIGYYTLELSRCVGPAGRVLAFEPMPHTFELLAGNLRAAQATNVSLFNAAASSSPAVQSMELPTFDDTGLSNPYQARLSADGSFSVLCLPLDSIPAVAPIRLIKIDAEGHDLEVLKGAVGILDRDRPTLIVEGTPGGDIADWLRARGYSVSALPGSSNIIALPAAEPVRMPQEEGAARESTA